MTNLNKQYCYWYDDASAEEPKAGFWMMYDSLEDAVSAAGDNIEIFEMIPKLLGIFERKVSIVKTKKGKK